VPCNRFFYGRISLSATVAGVDKHGLLAYPELTRIYYIQSITEHTECAFEAFKGVGFVCSLFCQSARFLPSKGSLQRSCLYAL